MTCGMLALPSPQHRDEAPRRAGSTKRSGLATGRPVAEAPPRRIVAAIRGQFLFAKREHDIAGRHRPHVLVELISGAIRVVLRRPHEAPADLGPVRLVLIHPPITHRLAADAKYSPDARELRVHRDQRSGERRSMWPKTGSDTFQTRDSRVTSTSDVPTQ